jgi:hypothetical protein
MWRLEEYLQVGIYFKCGLMQPTSSMVVDNKEAKLGPFVLMEVWYTYWEVAKWKTYNEELSYQECT